MAKNVWVEIAPGVRACFRNGALEIEMFGVEHGINQCEIDGVSFDQSYLPEVTGETQMFVRNQFFENKHGVLVSLAFYSDETPAQQEARRNSQEDVDFFMNYDESADNDDAAQRRYTKVVLDMQQRSQQPTKKVKPDCQSLDVITFPYWDDEMVLACWRGEKGPRTAAEAAVALREYIAAQLKGTNPKEKGDANDE